MKKWQSLLTAASAALLLAACSSNGADDSGESTADGNNDASEGIVELPTKAENDGEVIDGGTLKVALVSDSPFQGIFAPELYEDNYDASLMDFSVEELFDTDENFQITDTGSASLDLDQDKKMATITLKDGVEWSDGEPVTADDILFAYEIIGDPDYTGVRYDTDFKNIIGMEDFHKGDADEISGITVVDDQTLTIEYEEVGVQMLQAGGGVWGYAAPRHYLGDVPVADMASAPEVREKPIHYGPFAVSNVVPGESVEYTANEHYWRGAPHLDKVELTVVPTSNIVAALQNGEYDFALSMPTDNYDTYADLPGYTITGRLDLAYTYIGFKLGKWDDEKGEVVPDPNAKMADKSLRQAMGYAIDNDAVGAQFYQGLRYRANSPIVPVFSDYYNEDVPGYPYDVDKANALLDEAGYKDTNDDGIRETPEGEELVINFATMSGGETAEPIAEYYMQSWEQVGLKVQLVDGRLLDFQNFYDRVQSDDDAIDIFQGAWSTGTDPTPEGTYGRHAAFNLYRWATDENDQFMDDMTGDKSFDLDYRQQVFKDWQEYIMEEAPVIPTLYRQEAFPVNNRVKFYDHAYDRDPDFGWQSIELTADQPVKE